MTDSRIWPATDGRTDSSAEQTPVSLGTEFTLSAPGWAKALHYWRATEAELGTVTGSLYLVGTDAEVTGTAATFVISGVGWQTVALAAPVRLEANTRYIVSIHHPDRYAMGLGAYFDTGPGGSGITNGIITAPASATVTSPNGQGRYEYGPTRVAPRQTFNANAYLSDVTVSDVDPGGPATITPTGIASTLTVGQPSITPSPVTLGPAGIPSVLTLGTVNLTPGPVTLTPGGITATTAVGTPNITPSPVTLHPDGTGPTTTAGTPTLTPNPVTLGPAGIDATLTVGTPALTAVATLRPEGIDAGTNIGTPTLTPKAVTLRPAGIPSTTTVGAPTVRAAGDHSHEIGLGALTDAWTLGAIE